MYFTQSWAKCISMFGLQIRTPKVKSGTNSVSSSEAPKKHKMCFQKEGSQKDRKIQAQTELIAQQKLEAKHATGVSLH